MIKFIGNFLVVLIAWDMNRFNELYPPISEVRGFLSENPYVLSRTFSLVFGLNLFLSVLQILFKQIRIGMLLGFSQIHCFLVIAYRSLFVASS